MKNRITIYSKLLKDNLAKEGCEFISQQLETISRSMVVRFKPNNVSEETINKVLSSFKCIYRLEYTKETVTILLQTED